MSELFKSKFGMVLAGIHLSAILSCLMYLNLIDKTSVLPVVIIMILTFPWGTLLMFLFAQLLMAFGLEPPKYGELTFSAAMAIGGIVNAFIVYLLGFLLTKALNFFRK